MKSLNGLLLVNKAPGMTSHDVVARTRRILNIRSVGHCGTLDPMARGLMVLLIGEATKLSQYILEGDKAYRVDLRLGQATDTMDSTGKLLAELPVTCSEAEVEKAALAFQGEFELPVPIYSAVKVEGQKLYDYARNQEEVKIPQKMMKFWDIKKINSQHPEWSFSLACSKGSYIRTWVDELGKKLGCGAMMTGLERDFSTPYFLHQAQTLEQVEANIQAGHLPQAFIPMERALPGVKKIRIKGLDQKLLGNGQISHDLRVQLIQVFNPDEDEIVQIVSQDSGLMLALVGLEAGKGFVVRRGIKVGL
jgi:tRNA pseudouridine55 synthase